MAREQLVELGQDLVVEGDLDRIEGTIELLDGAGADDGSSHGRPGEQPGQGDDRGLVPDLVAELFVTLKLGAVRLEGVGGPVLVAADSLSLLADDASEEAALQRRPRE